MISRDLRKELEMLREISRALQLYLEMIRAEAKSPEIARALLHAQKNYQRAFPDKRTH